MEDVRVEVPVARVHAEVLHGPRRVHAEQAQMHVAQRRVQHRLLVQPLHACGTQHSTVQEAPALAITKLLKIKNLYLLIDLCS